MTTSKDISSPLFSPKPGKGAGLIEAYASPEWKAKVRGDPPTPARRVLNPPKTAGVQAVPDADDDRRREAQNAALLNELERGGVVTVSTARVLCGTWRLADRIADIAERLERSRDAREVIRRGHGVNAEYRLMARTPGPGGTTP